MFCLRWLFYVCHFRHYPTSILMSARTVQYCQLPLKTGRAWTSHPQALHLPYRFTAIQFNHWCLCANCKAVFDSAYNGYILRKEYKLTFTESMRLCGEGFAPSIIKIISCRNHCATELLRSLWETTHRVGFEPMSRSTCTVHSVYLFRHRILLS